MDFIVYIYIKYIKITKFYALYKDLIYYLNNQYGIVCIIHSITIQFILSQ